MPFITPIFCPVNCAGGDERVEISNFECRTFRTTLRQPFILSLWLFSCSPLKLSPLFGSVTAFKHVTDAGLHLRNNTGNHDKSKAI